MNQSNFHALTIVCPARNEAQNVERLVENAFSGASGIFDEIEMILVDDGSSDRTRVIAEKLASERRVLRVLPFNEPRGYGAALRAGFEAASHNLIFYTDADNQFDIHEIVLLLPLIKESDLVVGYRIDRQDSWRRIFTSRVYNRLVRAVFDIKVRDVDCSFKLFRKETVQRLGLRSEDFLIDVEMLALARAQGLRVVEHGVTHLPRAAGRSTVRLRHVFEVLRGIAALRRRISKNGATPSAPINRP